MFSHCLENTESPEVLAELEQFLCILCVSLEMLFWIFDHWSRLLKKLETPSVEMWFWILDDQGRLPKKLNVILISDNQRHFCKKSSKHLLILQQDPSGSSCDSLSPEKRRREKLFKLQLRKFSSFCSVWTETCWKPLLHCVQRPILLTDSDPLKSNYWK